MTSKIKKIQLKQVDDSSMTIHRKPYRNGYRFYNEANEQITDKSLLKRLKKLIIPPMWTDVRVCKWDDGHIQSIGRDLKGRKQYIYHSEWERRRQQEKFSKMVEFGEALPEMRKRVLRDINSGRWNRRKVLSMMVLILDDTGIRIGNHQYAERNGTYGLSTLRRKHLTVDDDVLTFEYKGKSNKMRHVEIEDENLIRLIKTSSELPGYEIFRYKTNSSGWSNVDSDDVNEYIRESMGENITSKDFRTWVASRVAVEYYPHAVETKSSAPRKKLSNILLRLVADELGNTPTVCKSYYVHPSIMQKIESGTLPISSGNKHNVFSTSLSDSEKIVLSIIG
jgi:DNA topoisomerase-1